VHVHPRGPQRNGEPVQAGGFPGIPEISFPPPPNSCVRSPASAPVSVYAYQTSLKGKALICNKVTGKGNLLWLFGKPTRTVRLY
jgi:hypothetical protein